MDLADTKEGKLRSLFQALWQQLASHATLIRFALVGGSGYLTYQALLFLAYDSPVFWFLPAEDTSADVILFEHADARFLIATLVASPLALVGQFTGHNLWTFRDRDSIRKPLWLRFGQFLATALIAVVITLATLNLLVVQFGMYHFVALPISIAFGGAWTWVWYTRLIWRRPGKQSLEE